MRKEKEHGHKLRILLVLRALLESPRRYTKNELAKRFGVIGDTINNDFLDLKNAGFSIKHDHKYRYYFEDDPVYQALQDLLHFSEDDQDYLLKALRTLDPHSKQSERIQRKISAIYDFTQLGYENLRKPYLTKINLLKQAKEEKTCVELKGYRSSFSSNIKDRTVEPFHVSPEEDILHAFALDKNEIRHFRISRINHIMPLDDPWKHEGKHNIMPTDPFRIVSKDVVYVHLRLSVGAYNELLERFPLTRTYIRPAAEPDMFDFEAKVNRQFFGIANFILGNYHLNIEVVKPESLKEHLSKMVEKMKF